MGGFSPAALNSAADAARDLKERLGQHGDLADGSTKQAAARLTENNYMLGPKLRQTAVTWWFQVNKLYKSCAALEELLQATAKRDQDTEESNRKLLEQLIKNFT